MSDDKTIRWDTSRGKWNKYSVGIGGLALLIAGFFGYAHWHPDSAAYSFAAEWISSAPFLFEMYAALLMFLVAGSYWLEHTESWHKEENTKRRFSRYAFQTLSLSVVYFVIHLFDHYLGYDAMLGMAQSDPALSFSEFISSTLISSGFAISLVLPSAVISMLGTMKASTAAKKSDTAVKNSTRMIEELSRAQYIARGATSDFEKCYRYVLIRPICGEDADWKMTKAQMLLSHPVFGFYSKFSKGCENYHEEFWEDFFACSIPRELILFSPDAHYNLIVRWILWLGATYINIKDSQTQLEALQTQISSNIKKMETNNRLTLWLTHDTGYRVVRYDYERISGNSVVQKDSNEFVLLTHLSKLNRSPRDFVGTLLPVTQNMHDNIAGSPDSIFEQYKYCPYSTESGGDAAVQKGDVEFQFKNSTSVRTVRASEFTAVRRDLLHLRTAHKMFHMPYLSRVCREISSELKQKKEAENKKKIALSDDNEMATVFKMINHVIEYYMLLNKERYGIEGENASADHDVFFSEFQDNRLNACTIAEVREALESSNTEDDIVEELFKLVKERDERFKSELQAFKTTLLGELTNWDKCIAVLYYLLSAGFRESIYARRRHRLADTTIVSSPTDKDPIV